jgi:hypothetical protein
MMRRWMAFERATMNTLGAKIYPVRALTQTMLFDKNLKMWQVPGTSYISVSHGVQKVGLSCSACHMRGGVMDFKALGFGPEQVKQRQWGG